MPRLFDGSSYLITLYALPTLLTMVAIFLLGVAALLHERISRVSLVFFLITTAVSIWLFAQTMLTLSQDPAVALWWARAAYLGVPFIAAATYHFTTVVLREYDRFRPAVLLGWIGALLFSGLAIGTDALFSGLYQYPWGYYARYNWLGLPFIVFFAGLLVASMAHYAQAYRSTAHGTHRRRIRALIMAFGIGYLAAFDFIPAYGVPLYPFGYLAILGFVLLSARAIYIYRLIDITPAFAANEIINTMNDGLLVLDGGGIVRLVNKAAVDLLGHPEEELLHKPVYATLKDPVFAHGEQFTELVRQGYVDSYELLYDAHQTGDGCATGSEARYLSVSASVKPGRDDDPAAIVCIIRDITTRKQAEEQLRRQNEYLAALHETSLGLIKRLQLADLLEAIIQRAASLVGSEHGYIYVVQQSEAGESHLVMQAGIGRFSQSVGQKLSAGEGLGGKVWQEGQTLMVEDYKSWPGRSTMFQGVNFHAVVGIPLTSGGQVNGVLGLAHLDEGRSFSTNEIELLGRFAQLASIALDNARLYNELESRVAERTSQLKAANTELEQVASENSRLYLEAQEAVRAREALLSVASHDLRNLLAAVTGSARLLQRYAQQPSDDHPELVETGLIRINAAATRMNALISEMLDFACLQAGQSLELYKRRTDVVALAKQVAAYHQASSGRSSISVVTQVPEVVGLWDAPRVERVLDNLLSNAIKYSPGGGDIVVEVGTEGTDGAWAVVSVADQGIGIPESDLPYVFEWFRRAANVSGRIRGTGIGLASARQVVEQHGGTLAVTSHEGAGSTFTVRLPRSS